MSPEEEAKVHLQKIEKTIEYHTTKLAEETRDGVKHMVKRELAALKYVRDLAKEALANKGIKI